MADEVKGIQIHADHFRALSRLSDEQRGRLLLGLIADAGFCEMPEMDFPTSLVFDMVIPSVHKAQASYQRQHEANIANGRKGGRPKKNQSQNQETDGITEKPIGFDENPTVSEENPKNQNRIEKNREEKISTESISSHDTELSTNSVYCAEPTTELRLKGRKKLITGKRAETFKRFWDAFGDKRGIAQAIDAWASIPTLTDSLVDRICEAAKQYADKRQDIRAQNGTPKMAQGWLNDRRWEDEEPEETCNIIRLRGKRTYA